MRLITAASVLVLALSSPLFAQTPEIVHVDTDFAGGRVTATGQGFGNATGRIVLDGVRGAVFAELLPVTWTDTQVVALLPPGLPDGTYHLEVFTKANGKGQPWSDRIDVTIGLQGPKGDAGEPGPAGPDGLQGPAGPAGAQGPAGPTGAQGPAGDTGPAGPTGPQGPAGPQGPQGVRGPQGPQGPQGPEGPAGPAGVAGPAGPTGPEGPVGPMGPIGLTGATGPAGPAGPSGVVGTTTTSLTVTTLNTNPRVLSGSLAFTTPDGSTLTLFAEADGALFLSGVAGTYGLVELKMVLDGTVVQTVKTEVVNVGTGNLSNAWHLHTMLPVGGGLHDLHIEARVMSSNAQVQINNDQGRLSALLLQQ